METKDTISHPIEPIIDSKSKILILGSFPSVKSRESLFFYMHPQNRFWKVLSSIFNDDFYNSDLENKKKLCLKHNIALFDVIKSCTIVGSSDSTIENVVVNDIPKLIINTKIKHIYCNGSKAYSLFNKYFPEFTIPVTKLPSTSPANAKDKIDDLIKIWSQIGNI